MKIRSGFVTNSSSSSYICVMCDAKEESWDFPDGWVICENEHHLCDKCAGSIPDESLDHNGQLPATTCPVCRLEAYSNHEMSVYLLKTRQISRDEVFAEIKKVNKRRRKLYDTEYIEYVLRKENATDDIILKEIKDKFVTWDAFCKFTFGR